MSTDLCCVGGVVSCACLCPIGDNTCAVPLGPCVAMWCPRTGSRTWCIEACHDTISSLSSGPGDLLVAGSTHGEIVILSPNGKGDVDGEGEEDGPRWHCGKRWSCTPEGERPRAVDHAFFAHGGRWIVTLTRCFSQHSIVERREQVAAGVVREAQVSCFSIDGSLRWSRRIVAFGVSVSAADGVVVVVADGDPDDDGCDLPSPVAGREAGDVPSGSPTTQRENQRLVVMSLEDGAVVATVPEAGPRITSIDTVAEGGGAIVCGCADGRVFMYDLVSQAGPGDSKEMQYSLVLRWDTCPSPGTRIRCLSVRGDGGAIAAPGRGGIAIIDPRDGTLLTTGRRPGDPKHVAQLPGVTRGLAWCRTHSPAGGRGGWSLWTASEYAMSLVEVDLERTAEQCAIAADPVCISRHNLANCGVAIDPTGTAVACADLSGGVHIYKSIHEGFTRERPPLTLTLPPPVSVRAVDFSPRGLVVAASLDGSVWALDAGIGNSCENGETGEAGVETDHADRAQLVCTLPHSVTSLSHHPSPPHSLAAGTTDGEVAVIEGKGGSAGYGSDVTFRAHAPGMEVWSVSWSPCGTALATSSEDHTTRLWRWNAGAKSLALAAVLEGHEAAVTCNDWKTSVCGGVTVNILATSSDDRTVRVYATGRPSGDPTDARLVHVLNTRDYLVTYVTVCDGGLGTSVACVTEDGFRYVWRLDPGHKGDIDEEPSLTERRKVHSGSVEGLAWSAATGTLASCASDCTLAVCRLKGATTKGATKEVEE